jgi:cytochrome P450
VSDLRTAPLPGLLSPEVEADPDAHYRNLRDRTPIHFDSTLGAYLLTRHADVGTAYRDPVFSSRSYERLIEPVFGRSLLQMDGREHSRKRALVSPYFLGKGLETWMPMISDVVTSLLDRTTEDVAADLLSALEPGSTVDLCDRLARRLPVTVITRILGLPDRDVGLFERWYNAHTRFIGAFGQDPEIDRLGRQARQELWDYLTPVIAERRNRSGDDLISNLITSEVDGERLDDIEIKTHITQLLNAGSETTGKALASLLAHLLLRRELFEQVHDDRELLTPAISETLRYTPPSQMNSRETTEDVELHGTPIPAGSLVLLVIASANRDERRFAHSNEFDPHRTDLDHGRVFSSAGEHFAFGAGRHFCLGARLAKSEIEIAATALLDRFPGMRLADDTTPVWRGVKARALDRLMVTL